MLIARMFVCMLVVSLAVGEVLPAVSAADYGDYYIKGGKIVTNDTGIKYQITKSSDNTTSVKWNRAITTSGAVGISKYTVYAQDNRNGTGSNAFKLNAINKYTGNNRWSMSLDQAYSRLQFIGGKYAVLMNAGKYLQINLYTHRIVTGKTFNYTASTFFGLIKSKKNGNYYVMTIEANNATHFYKLNAA